ncbi:MAG: FxsA family protein [Gammaproteobacteria bacterium]|nr:FxsA family protein [Gammaproteobacteria bacterium]
MPILFIIFVIVPIIEIALFVQAEDWIGLAPTLVMIVLTAVIGISLLRQQGLSTLYKAQEKMNHGEIPAMEMIEGIMLAIAGTLLLTPGFFTDTIGFLLLVPPLRRYLFTTALQNKVKMYTQGRQAPFNEQEHYNSSHSNRTIEGDYKNTDD